MKKVLVITGLSLAGIILVAGVAVLLIINNYLGKINYDTGTESAAPEAVDIVLQPDEAVVSHGPDSSQPVIDQLELSIKENIESTDVPLVYNDDVINVLLIGIDTRQNSDVGNSDTMILISINRKTSKIIETSLLRDIYLNVPGYSQGNRLNAAYAWGGPSLLLKTIQDNFKIDVDRYIAVNFYAFMKIIDQIGGVSVNVSAAETKVANDYIREINSLRGLPLDDGLLTAPGQQDLNGKQALGYVRIRYIGNADFGRTDRQRLVLNLVFDKVKTLKLSQLDGLLNTFLPEVRTNLERGELLAMILSIPAYAGYERDSWYVPMDGTYEALIVRGMEVIGIDFAQNISELQRRIYG